MSKAIIFFKKGSGVRYPIVKTFNIPPEINIPTNVNTFKTSNLSIQLSCKKEGMYKLVGEFENINNIDYLKVNMIMEITDMDSAIEQIERSL